MAASLAAMFAAPATAGGYDTGERDWDLLFQRQPFAFEAGVLYVEPRRQLTDIVGTLGPSGNVGEAESFAVPRFGAAVQLGEHARCLASYREPWAGHADYGSAWTYAASAVEQHFSSSDYGLTCSVHTGAGPGELHLLGGVSLQRISYELKQAFGPAGLASTNVKDSAAAWRVGLAYEIPDYALRVSLIYNSAVAYDMTGNFTAFGSSVPVFGAISMPQSIELKAQSGIAPDWLLFGAVRWTDWSVAANMPLCPVGTPLCSQTAAVSGLTLLWKDSWTATAGAAHRFSDTLSVAASLTWDQGATQGFTSQTDTWTGSLTAVATPGKDIQLDLTGTIGLMTGGTLSTLTLADGSANPVGYTARFGTDMVYGLRASAAVRF